MNKRTILICILLLVSLLVAGAIYKHPVTLSQLYPNLEVDSCKNITAYYSADKTGDDNRVEFPSGSKEFDLLIEQIKYQKFSKSLQNFLPSDTKSHRWNEGDFKWEIILEFDDSISVKDGGDSSGTVIHLTNFFGDLTIYNMIDEQSILCHTENQTQWTEEIMHILSGE